MHTSTPEGYIYSNKSANTANTSKSSEYRAIRGITDKSTTSDDPANLLHNYVIKRKCKK